MRAVKTPPHCSPSPETEPLQLISALGRGAQDAARTAVTTNKLLTESDFTACHGCRTKLYERKRG